MTHKFKSPSSFSILGDRGKLRSYSVVVKGWQNGGFSKGFLDPSISISGEPIRSSNFKFPDPVLDWSWGEGGMEDQEQSFLKKFPNDSNTY